MKVTTPSALGANRSPKSAPRPAGLRDAGLHTTARSTSPTLTASVPPMRRYCGDVDGDVEIFNADVAVDQAAVEARSRVATSFSLEPYP